jgi:hypothetical protein
LEIFSIKRRNGRAKTCESVKWLKGAKLEGLEDAVVI